MIKSMYYLCKEYHGVACVLAIILFILTDVLSYVYIIAKLLPVPWCNQ